MSSKIHLSSKLPHSQLWWINYNKKKHPVSCYYQTAADDWWTAREREVQVQVQSSERSKVPGLLSCDHSHSNGDTCIFFMGRRANGYYGRVSGGWFSCRNSRVGTMNHSELLWTRSTSPCGCKTRQLNNLFSAGQQLKARIIRTRLHFSFFYYLLLFCSYNQIDFYC